MIDVKRWYEAPCDECGSTFAPHVHEPGCPGGPSEAFKLGLHRSSSRPPICPECRWKDNHHKLTCSRARR